MEGDTFDPSTAERRFTIAVNNYAAVVAVGPILAAVRAQAPAVRLSLVPSGTLNLTDRLDRGELDLALSGRALDGERSLRNSSSRIASWLCSGAAIRP